MAEIPSFETSRLWLRGVTEADAPAYQRHFADYAVISELAARVPWPYPQDGALAFIRDVILPAQGKDKWVWGLYLKTSPDELIGIVDLWRQNRPENRGFWLGRAFWGRGLMTEATAVITDHAFDGLGFKSIILSNAVGNLRSRRVKEKAGAVWLRTEPFRFVNPAYTEREVWELTPEQWKKFRGEGP